MMGISQALRMFSVSSYFVKLRTGIKSNLVRRQNANNFSTTHFPIDNISNLKQDIILYTYERSKLSKFLAIAGIAQLGIWIFYGSSMFVSLGKISKSDIKSEEVFTKSFLWRNINLKDQKLRIVSSLLCFGIGIFTACMCCVLPARIINELTLRKGGSIASVVTYNALGRVQRWEIPLKNLSCTISRNQGRSYIAIKIKPKWFYYLIDCNGKFHHPKLFDYTIGTRSAKAY